MKPNSINLFLLPLLIVALPLIPAGRVSAQTFTTVHDFTGGSDGAAPEAGLVLSGNTLYGTAAAGGSSGHGTVFAVSTDGTGFTTLHSFTATSIYYPYGNSDGAGPYAGLILWSNTLYGTAQQGGIWGHGAVFRVNTDGTDFTNLHSFSGGSDGANVTGGLILSGNILYGTSSQGGSGNYGTVFALSTDGTGFTTLHNFTYYGSDGGFPHAGLSLLGNTLYGTAAGGGSSGKGTVFALNTDGTGVTALHSFTAFSIDYPYGNSDGAHPNGGLTLGCNTLYGTAYLGGSSGNGTVFKLNTNGAGFTTLHSFTGSEGGDPVAALAVSGKTLYGTGLYGAVFAVNTDGTGFTNLAWVGSPYGGLILSGSALYGTASQGGYGYGAVFSISFRPPLTITPSGTNVILSWPATVAGFDYTGYTLQSTTNLVSPVVWSTNTAPSIIVNGQSTVTNPISGPQQFFRLSQ